jgi:plastocyanin
MTRRASRRRSSTRPAVTLLVPAVALVLAWGRSSTASTRHTVEIRGLSFIPEQITIDPGDTVTWTNFDDDRHKLKGGRMNSPEMKMGDEFSFRFDHPGKVAYTCTVHTYMQIGRAHV